MFARTERLLLRPGWIEDAPALARTINDEAIARNLARVPWPYTLADAETWLGLEQAPDHPSLLVFARTNGAPRLVGGCGLHQDEDDRLAIGYWIARPFWGLGYATEACRALINAASASGARRIAGEHYVDNPASGRVLRKLGFRASGRVNTRFSIGRGCAVASVDYVLDVDEAEPAKDEDAMRIAA